MSDDVSPAGAGTGVGAKVAGYVLEEQIGRGGMAVVFRAHDERLDRQVALKLLAPGLAADTAFRLRFIRESRAAAAVDHPNIIPVYDAGDADGSLFIAMRYVQGGDAKTALRQAGALPPARAWAIITQVAAALDAAHSRGLIHRDVKPANMLLDVTAATGADHGVLPGGQAEHVYLSDFGISKQSLSSNLTSTGQFVGTLDYVAPEQIEGRETDGRADQYSLACAAYELLSGVPPFRRDQGVALLYAQLSEPPPAITASRPGLPPAVDRVLAIALAKAPADRYPSCGQFAIELGRALNLIPGSPGTPGPADLPSTAGHLKPWPATELVSPVSLPDAKAVRPEEAVSGHLAPAGAGVPGGLPGRPATTPGGPVLGGPVPALPPAVLGAEEPTRRPPQAPHPQPTLFGPGWQAGSPGGPTAPGWPGAQGQPPGGKRRRSGALLAGTAIAVVVIAVAAVAAVKLIPHSGGTATSPPASPSSSAPSSSPPSTAATQAQAVNDLLTSSAASRMPLGSAVTDVTNCTNLPGAVAQIQQIVNERDAEYNKASNLSTDALPNGVTLKSDLMRALLNSLNADKYYLAWAQHRLNFGCSSQSSAYNDALNADVAATQSKQAFVEIWNPIATTYGYQQQSTGTI